jgi:hypothetical protein
MNLRRIALMRLLPVLILICLLAPTALAEDELRNPQVSAATADALAGLKREVVAAHVTSDLTIEDVLDRVGGGDELERTLLGAEQLGGARWLGDQAVQVRLSIDGTRIGKTLLKIVQAHPKQSPIAPDALQRELHQLGDRTFSATGTSTGAADISHLRPPPSQRAWWGVSDADRRTALATARNDAINHVLESLGPISLGGATLAQALRDASISDAIKGWLSSQPIKTAEFEDDLSVKLTLSAPVEGLWPVLRGALGRQKQVPLPGTQAEWDRLQHDVATHVAPAQGIGTVQAPVQPAAAQGMLLPAQAPAWAIQQAETEATSSDDGARLRTARRAEALALEKLRHVVEGLPLAQGVTVGGAAERDPRIAQAVVRALGRARPFKVDYGAKGSVTVHVAFRLSDLWAELTGQQ